MFFLLIVASSLCLKELTEFMIQIHFTKSQNYPGKHSSWWWCTENVLKTSWRCLQCNIFVSSKTSSRHNCNTSSWSRLEDVLKKTSCKHVLKMFWKTSWRRLAKTSFRRFQNSHCNYVLKAFSRRLQDFLEDEKLLRWRRLEDVLQHKKCLVGI